MSKRSFYQSYLPYLLAQAAHRQSIRFHRELKQRGIRELDWRILATLSGSSPRTVNDLAAETIVPQPTMSRRLSQMERNGLVRRAVDGNDARVVFISLTTKGAALASDLIKHAQAAQRRDAAGLSAAEKQQLGEMLSRLIEIDASDVA